MTLSRNALRLGVGAAALAIATFGFIARDGHVPLPEHPAEPAQPSAPAPSASPAPKPDAALDAIREASPQTNAVAVAYAPNAQLETPNPILRAPDPVNVDIPGLREALAAYQSGDIAKGDQEAARVSDPTAKAMLSWVALQKEPRVSTFPRMSAFLASVPDWAARPMLDRRAEEILLAEKARPQLAANWFSTRQPQSAAGRLALARAELAAGKEKEARARIAAVWRNEEMSVWLENQTLKEFGDGLTEADHKARAIRFAYPGKAAATRAAAKAGDDVVALVKARMAVVAEAASDKLMAAVPASMQKEPLYLLSKAQKLRRAGDIDAAFKTMVDAPRDRAALVDPDEWWVERRVLARKLLDAKRPEDAYKLVAEHSAQGREQFIEAEFHAGWIALRFLNDPARAAPHFDLAGTRAETPISRARVAYWQGRTAEAGGGRDKAREFYRAAAKDQTVYYGQLAKARLGETLTDVRKPRDIAKGDARNAATRVTEMLMTLGEKDLAATLATEAVKSMTDEAQIAALADVMARAGDARATLSIGKTAIQRGHTLDEAAYPTFGIPYFEPALNSAPMAVVYAIARQESAFAPRALSTAGAKGLMQMIDATAKRTAQQVGVTFDKARLIEDPAFNAFLGAAHLGQLISDFRGSYILTFVAYNAGPRRVKEWIEAYGDPRNPAVDPVDWVERIPFTETRNYVQRVTENLEIYRLRFGDARPFAIRADLRGAEAKL
jgi:soluble lytic murein transglycosylase